MALNASALPLRHPDLLYFVSSLRKYNVYVSTGRSGVGVSRMNSRQPFLFFRRRRRVSIYITYTCRHLETREYNYNLNARLQITLKRRLKANALRVKRQRHGAKSKPPYLPLPRRMIYPYTFDQLTAPFADVVDALFNSEIILGRSGVVVRRWRSKP